MNDEISKWGKSPISYKAWKALEKKNSPSPVKGICPGCKEEKDLMSMGYMLSWQKRCEECWDKRYDGID